MTGGRWRIGGSVFTVVVLLIGAVVVASSMTRRSSEDAVAYTGVRRLVVDNPGGSLVVRAGRDDGPVRVHRRAVWTLTAPWLADRQDGETLSVRAACGGNGMIRFAVGCQIAYEMEVPPQTQLTATTSGRIEVTGVTGPLDLTSPGPITVTGARGPVSTRTRG